MSEMQVDPCGCLWDWAGDTLNIAPCAKDKPLIERCQQIAWRLVAQRGCSFREAWGALWERLISRWITKTIRQASQ